MDLWLPSQLSQEMIDLAQEVNDKYPNLSLAWIPPENRGEGDERPFAIIQIDSEGNQIAIIHRMHQLEVHGAYVFNWLWANDSQRVDVYDQYLKSLEAEEIKRDKQNREKIDELADVVHMVAKSNKHEYKLNGHKIGSENNYPTLGLRDYDDAS